MTHLRFIISFICIWGAILIPAWADIYLSDEEDGIDRQKIYHVQEGVDLVPTLKVSYFKSRIVVKATYPLLTSDYLNYPVDAFNQLIDTDIKEEITDFRNKVSDFRPLQKNLPRTNLKNELVIDFNTAILDARHHPIISIRLSIQGYIEGLAHPYHRHRVLNFDLETGEKIELQDLFRHDANYLAVLSNYVRPVLMKKLRNQNFLMGGADPQPDNYKNWNLTPTGLLITFDEYQVAPYVFGTQHVLIPYAALRKIISPHAAMSSCLKHPKRCLQNNVLTGGFVES